MSYKLPKPHSRLGYSKTEISRILHKLKIGSEKFWEAFGVNTVACTKKGYYRYYKCDVERALYNLGSSSGIYHAWD